MTSTVTVESAKGSARRVHAAYLYSVPLAFRAIPPVVAQLSATQTWQAIATMLLR